jgi:hypothetical protein
MNKTRVYLVVGIGGNADPAWKLLRAALAASGVRDVHRVASFERGPKWRNAIEASLRLLVNARNGDAEALAAQIAADHRASAPCSTTRVVLVALSAGADTAVQAASLLERQGIPVHGLLTLGGIVRRPKPANVERWIGLIGSHDWARWLPVSHPDRIIELPGARHNDYATRHANVVVEVASDFTAGVREIIAPDRSSE